MHAESASTIEVLAKLSRTLKLARTITDVVAFATNGTRDLLGVHWATIALLKVDRSHATLYDAATSASASADEVKQRRRVIELEGTAMGAAVRQGDLVHVRVDASDYVDVMPLAHFGFTDAFAIPMYGDDRMIGTINAASSEPWSKSTLVLAEHWADLVGAEIALRRGVTERQVFEECVNNNPNPVIATDTRGNIVHANRAAEDNVGCAVGSSILVCIPEVSELLIREVAARGSQKFCEVTVNDRVFAFDLYRGTSGANVLFYGREVTEEAAIADALKDADVVRAAYAEADAARRTAERAVQVRQQFLSHMSHEIRTPLAAVLAYTERLNDGLNAPNLDAEQMKESVEVIYRSGSHLRQLLDDVLDLARMESGKFALEPEEAAIRQLLGDAVSLFKLTASRKGISLTQEISPDLPRSAYVDAPRLRQILVNLIGNAVKFTSSGGVLVRARTEQDTGRPLALIVEIQDTGIGIPPDRLSSVFDAFSTQGTHAGSKGTGLGLPISLRLAKLLGGDIHIASTPGQGTTMSLRVLLENPSFANLQGARMSMPLPQEVPDSTLRHNLSGAVLVVEDTEPIAKIVAEWLRDRDLEVTVATNGQAALDAVASRAPTEFDLILMDMGLPILDGYQTTKRLRESGYQAPILAFTAHALADERARVLGVGCDGLLTKPIQRRDLFDAIDEFLPAASEQAAHDKVGAISPELLGAFVEDMQGQRQRLKQAVDAGRLTDLMKIGHQLAGVFGFFGHEALGKLSHAMESAAKRRDRDESISTARAILAAIASIIDPGPTIEITGVSVDVQVSDKAESPGIIVID